MDHEEIRRRVWDTVQALNRAWAVEGNIQALSDYFHPDMVAITASDRHPLVGREACVASWKRFVNAANAIRYVERDPRIEIHGAGTCAVVTYEYDLCCELGGRPVRLGGRDMLVLVREGDRWRVVADHFSPFPGATMSV